MLPVEILKHLEKHYGKVLSFHSLSGGCINSAGIFRTNSNEFFIKWNNKEKFPNMFESEARGLEIMREKNGIRIPKVNETGNSNLYSFIILEYIRPGKQNESYWNTFGKQLAELHLHTAPNFGLDHENYIGALHQSNHYTTNWIDFFVSHRLEPQIELLKIKNKWPSEYNKALSHLIMELASIFPNEKPALLHGDLWSGNLLTDNNGCPVLIDPAVYFGHREMDLAFSMLFGGFDDEYIQSYNEIYPLQPGLKTRTDYYNLYPLLVHANLFGDNYLNQIGSILHKFK